MLLPCGWSWTRLRVRPATTRTSNSSASRLPTEAVGTSPGVTGTLLLGADGSIAADQSTITVDLTKLKSDESRRDNFIKTDTLQTSKFPTATFVAHAVQGLPTPLPTSGQATFQLSATSPSTA